MTMLERVRESKSGSWAVAAASYVLATGGALFLRRFAGGDTADLAGALLMSGSLIVTALVMRSPAYPRWSLIAASWILAAGMIVPVLVAGVPVGEGSPIGTWGYGWLYLVLLGGTRAAGPRWCHSPWVVVGAAVVLSLAGGIAQNRL